MTLPSGRAGVGEILGTLAKEVDPVIQTILAPHLNGLPWTTVLVELDRSKGRTGKVYDPSDIQCQLRILTERLGGLGFPFDDKLRSVSTVAGELRIVRNRWAHLDDFDPLDLWRAADFAQRLLENLGAPSDRMNLLAQEALQALSGTAHGGTTKVEERGVMETAAADLGTGSSTESVDAPSSTSADQPPRPDAPASSELVEQFVPESHPPFEPWTVVTQETGVIQALPKKAAKEKVRATASEIVDLEGPVKLTRVVRLVAQTYGVARLAEKRRQQVVRQIDAAGIRVDSDGFAWPEGVEPTAWTTYRPNGPEIYRLVTEVSPIELRNACADVAGDLTGDERLRAVLAVFGRTRLTTGNRAYLERALG